MSTSTQTTITKMKTAKTIKIFGIEFTYVPDKTYLKWHLTLSTLLVMVSPF